MRVHIPVIKKKCLQKEHCGYRNNRSTPIPCQTPLSLIPLAQSAGKGNQDKHCYVKSHVYILNLKIRGKEAIGAFEKRSFAASQPVDTSEVENCGEKGF